MMQTNLSSILQSIDATVLAPVVSQSLRRDTLQIGDWRITRLGGGIGNPVSAGLYRVEGTGQDHAGPVDWSVILKIIQSPANVGMVDMGEGDDPSHWNYWKREVLVYRSGLLEALPAGLLAPRCLGSAELPGNFAWLWLEDIHDSYQGAWPLARYALAARHLGRLNGSYVSERPLPAVPWLGRHLVRQWLNSMPHWRTIPWDHPRLLQRYPGPGLNPFRRMLGESERFLAALERLPKTVCHGDTYPTNFMSRTSASGQEHTVALDWALMGLGPLGDDLGQLVFGAQRALTETAGQQIAETLFESYLDGLRDSGCHLDPRLVRLGYQASAALRVGLFQLFLLGEELSQAAADVPGSGEEQTGAQECFETEMATGAYASLAAIA